MFGKHAARTHPNHLYKECPYCQGKPSNAGDRRKSRFGISIFLRLVIPTVENFDDAASTIDPDAIPGSQVSGGIATADHGRDA